MRFDLPLSATTLRSLILLLVIHAQLAIWQPNLRQLEAQEDVIQTAPESVIEKWEFGLEISSDGNAAGVLASVPVPIEWPEQSIEILKENDDSPITRLSYKKIGKNAKQLIIKINRMHPGDIVVGSVIMEIEKSTIEVPDSTAELRFPTRSETRKFSRYLEPSPYIESRHPRIKELAAGLEIDESATPWEQTRSIFEWVRDNITYEFDPTIRTCLEALDREQGDCEEMSSLFIAICRARGIPARAVWIPDHTYPEFCLLDEAGDPHWFPCQVAGEYEFGSMNETKPILQKGDKFKIAGHQNELRYIQPTLTAKDHDIPPTVKWVMRKIEDE